MEYVITTLKDLDTNKAVLFLSNPLNLEGTTQAHDAMLKRDFTVFASCRDACRTLDHWLTVHPKYADVPYTVVPLGHVMWTAKPVRPHYTRR